jgi:hypothetical protein
LLLLRLLTLLLLLLLLLLLTLLLLLVNRKGKARLEVVRLAVQKTKAFESDS